MEDPGHEHRDGPGGGRRSGAPRRLGALALGCVLGAVVLGACTPLGIGKKTPFPAKNLSVFTLHSGECLNPPSKVVAEVSSLSVTSCKAPHTEQVFALVKDNAGSAFPGPQKLETFANAKCLQHFAAFVGVPYQQSSLFYTYLLPSVRSWAAGDRTVTCVVTTTGAKLTNSVEHAKR